MTRLHIDHISKRYEDGTTALYPLELTIDAGEFFVLVGPSGCGKSTLLHILAGLEPPSAGKVWLAGRDVTGLDARARNMAMVFQNYALYPHMSVAENLAFPLRMARTPRTSVDKRVREMAALLQLDALLARKPAALSGGQRQRVAMGRALIRAPAVFLMDEPLSNLDAQLRVQMRSEIARLHGRLRTTTVYVTHDQTEAMTLGERIAVLREGTLQQVGPPQRLFQHPANVFVARFFGTPTINLLPLSIREGRLVSPLPGLALPTWWAKQSQPPAACVAGIRPQAWRLAPPPGEALAWRPRLQRIEWLGADTLAYCAMPAWEAPQLAALQGAESCDDAPPADMVVRLPPDTHVQAGSELTLWLAPEDVLWFEPRRGERLGPPGSPPG